MRRKGQYVNETFLRRKDAEEWALDMERRIDRQEPGPRASRVTQNSSAISLASTGRTWRR